MLFHNSAECSEMNIKRLRDPLHAVATRGLGLCDSRVSGGHARKHSTAKIHVFAPVTARSSVVQPTGELDS